jgi:hypothetical protein
MKYMPIAQLGEVFADWFALERGLQTCNSQQYVLREIRLSAQYIYGLNHLK